MTTIIIISILVGTYFLRSIIKSEKSQESEKSNDGSVNKSVSWGYVESELGWAKDRIQNMRCPKCGLESNNLDWFKFRTSNDSWRHLAGREGFYSKCPNCLIIVDDIITVMN